MSIQQLATQSLAFFETKTRDYNRSDTFHPLKDSAPEWLRTLVYAAHGNAMLNDWKYDFIVQCLGAIGEADNADKISRPEPSIYTHELTGWLHSSVNRVGYVDEACEDGGPQRGLVHMLQLGQEAEIAEVFESVHESLLSHLVDLEAV